MEMLEIIEEMLRRIIAEAPHTLLFHTALVMLRMFEEGGDAC